jgi:yeast amino acid transporter
MSRTEEKDTISAVPPSPTYDLKEEPARPQLRRSLGARHLQMLAIASSIGTGLFIGSGKALRTGGPFSLVFSFMWLGLVLTSMMRMLPCVQ